VPARLDLDAAARRDYLSDALGRARWKTIEKAA
jgi:hypothetical protein